MKRTGRAGLLLAVFTGLAACCGPAFAQETVPKPLVHVHSHNDYLQARPLFGALSHGFTSVEADIFLVKGRLLVGHMRSRLRSDRTLKSMYLDPLQKLVQEHRGRVEPGWPQVRLLIDIKTKGPATYKVLTKVLANYPNMLTVFGPSGVKEGPLLAIISGNRPLGLMLSQRVRYAAYDGRLTDLGSTLPASFMPWISADWNRFFAWNGKGPMPAAQEKRLEHIAQEVHAHGRKLRFWATPDAPGTSRTRLWTKLMNDGVDLLGTNHLAALQSFLQHYRPGKDGPGSD